MKNLLLPTCLFVLTIHGFSQTVYNQYRSTITCPLDKDELASSAHEKIRTALDMMVKEGSVLLFEPNKSIRKEKIRLAYVIPAENDETFKQITEAWKKKTLSLEPALFKTFWETCSSSKDTLYGSRKMMYPVIKDASSGVVVVSSIDEVPDRKLQYKIVMDFTAFPEREEKKGKVDSVSVNWALSEIGRFYNLHVAAGIPTNKINIVAAVHANAMETFFTNEAYRDKYKIDNPNLKLVEALSNAGVKFLICGQSLTWWGYKKEMLVPQARVTLTAQTTLTSYQMKGYALKDMGND